MTERYKITRTGRRATKLIVQLSSGKKVLQATGPHVWELTAADLALVRSLPCVHVVPIDPPPPPKPKKPAPSEKATKAVEKAEAKKAKSAKKK